MNPYGKEVLEYVSLTVFSQARSQKLVEVLTVLTVGPTLTCTLQKNAAGKIIIVYDEDERIASQAATTMCQRGFENLFMLSGGPSALAEPQLLRGEAVLAGASKLPDVP